MKPRHESRLPYQYVTTALFTPCGAPGGSCNASSPKTWGADCGSQRCYGVPLYRETLTNTEFAKFHDNPDTRPQIRMMGQGTGQRSNMTYSLYIGRVSEQKGLAAVTPGRVGIQSGDYQFTPVAGGNWLLKKQYDPATGLLTLTVDLSQQREEFENDRPNFCQPRSYCSYQPATQSCGCKKGSSCKEDSVCSWAVKDIDCPIAGCSGLSIKLPDNFVAAKQPGLPPPPIRYTGDPASNPFFHEGNVRFENASEDVAGSCYYNVPPMQQ